MEKIVTIESFDVAMGLTNYVAWGLSANGWETNGLTSFSGGSLAFPIDVVVTNGEAYAKVFRDFNANGTYDAGIDALVVQRLTTSGNDKPEAVRIGDSDYDGVSDGVELNEGTDPVNDQSYCFNMAATVTGIFHTTNKLTLVAMFGGATICGPLVMTTNVWSMDFGHLLATNGEKVVLKSWDDANSNGVHDAVEAFSQCSLPVTNHSNICTLKLPYGGFDSDGNNLPDWWEVVTGLAEYAGPHGEFDDADGDGLINLHEYWAGCDPLVPDGSNTLLSVAARSVDDRIAGKSPVNSLCKFENYQENGSNSIFVLNTNFWAYGVNTSCASMWNNARHDLWNGLCDEWHMAGTAISPRHIMYAHHYAIPHGTTLYFMGTDGNVHIRTLTKSCFVTNDIHIGLLNADLPPSIRPAKVLPATYEKYIGTARMLPVVTFDQEEKLIICDSNALRCFEDKNLLSAAQCPRNPHRQDFYENLINGDSGNPRFLLIDNELVLLYVIYGGGGGSGCFVTHFFNAIQSKMDVLQTGYHLESFDFSGYQELSSDEIERWKSQ